MRQRGGFGVGNRGRRLLAVCLLGIGVVPAFARERKTPRVSAPRRDAYVLSRAGGTSNMSASVDDLMALRSRYSEDFLWFRRGGREYLISDSSLIEEAARFFDPLRALRPQQKALAERERKLDREEEALDREHDAATDSDEYREARLDEDLRAVETRLRAVQEQQRDVEREERILDAREEDLDKAAEAKLERLFDGALRNGLARPVQRD